MRELSVNPEFESLQGLLGWMQSYLDTCPRHLKKCMLYLSIFAHDTIIRWRHLIRRWIAEGYSKGTDSISIEKYAEKIFDEVAALSIMQAVLEAGKVIGYRINGFFREYAMSRPVEETIFFPVEVSVLEKQGNGRVTTEGIGQHLAIGSTWDSMRVLRVLDLENARNLYDKLEMIGKLPSRLKFLSLRGQKITRLPDSVGELSQLQTLDIRDTRIVMLPAFLTKLRKLQYIRAGTTVAWTHDSEEESMPPSSSRWCSLASCLSSHGRPVFGSCSGGVKMPRGIKKLEALQTLGTVFVNTSDSEAILDEVVCSLSQLKKLEISGISSKQGRSSFHFLGMNTHLESLSLQFEKNNPFVHWGRIYFPKSLRSLKMVGHVEQVLPLPWFVPHADNLRKVTLEMAHALFTSEVIQQHWRLPSLHTLRLRVSKDDEQHGELRFPTARFSKLQVLEIACKSKLHVMFVKGTMQKLEQLKFHCLQGSEMQFSGLEHPISLKQVWLLGSFDDALKEAVQQQLAKHPKKPAPKLEVQ